MGMLSDFVKSRFGGKARYNPRPITNTAAVGVTQIWRENADRFEVVIMNLSANVLYVHTEPTVSATNGILLAASGGSVILTAETDGEWVGYPFYIYAGTESTIFSAEVTG